MSSSNPLPRANVLWVNNDGTPTQALFNFLRAYELGQLGPFVGNAPPFIGSLGNFANDVAAAAGGVPVGALYRNGSVVQIRVT